MTAESATPSVAGVSLRKPYLLFIGDVDSKVHAKTAFGLRDWARDACLAQLRLPQSQVDLRTARHEPRSGGAAGAVRIVIGVAPVGGQIPSRMGARCLLRAVCAGLDVVSGMHGR